MKHHPTAIEARVEYELTNASSGPGRVRRNLSRINTRTIVIITEEPLRAGTRLVMRFELTVPGMERPYRIICCGSVSQRIKRGLKVEILQLDEEDREAILEVLTAQDKAA